MPLNQQSFKISLVELPTVHSSHLDDFLLYLVQGLGLVSNRSSPKIAQTLLKLLVFASEVKNGKINSGVHDLEVIEGGLTAENILKFLKAHESGIGLAQLYNNYLLNFVRSGLVVKKKYSVYALKHDNLEKSLREMELDLKKEFEKIKFHAQQADLLSKQDFESHQKKFEI